MFKVTPFAEREKVKPFNEQKKNIICFEWQVHGEGQYFVFDAKDLMGVHSGCAFGAFPGTPKWMSGLVLWNNKLIPVLNLSPVLGDSYSDALAKKMKEDGVIFLFMSVPEKFQKIQKDLTLIALAIPASILTYLPNDEEKTTHYLNKENFFEQVFTLSDAVDSEAEKNAA